MNLLITQNSANLKHKHGGKTGETQPIFSGTNTGNKYLSAYKPTIAGITTPPFYKGSTTSWNLMTNSSSNETYQLYWNYTPAGTVSKHTHDITEDGETESRPIDFTYKVWKRTA